MYRSIGRNTFIQNIVASDTTELCNYLNSVNWTWPICSIDVFSQPADNRFVDPNNTCNVLTPVDFKTLPACLNLALSANGLTIMGMEAEVEIVFEYVGFGGVIAGGAAPTSTTGTVGPDPQYVGFGGVIAGGIAPTIVIPNVGYATDMGMDIEVQDLVVIFSTLDNNEISIQGESETIATECVGCNNLPLVLNLLHNLDQAAVLLDFCTRNGLQVPTKIPMYYSNRLNAWQSVLHYTGVSDDNQSSTEQWRILFDWACTSSVGGQEYESSFWKFGVSVVRKNIVTGKTTDTRLMIVFPPDAICSNISTGFDFSFDFDTQKISVSTNQNIVVDIVLLYDNIGLFRSQAWVVNPDLIIEITQNPLVTGFTQQDIFPIFPQAVTLGV